MVDQPTISENPQVFMAETKPICVAMQSKYYPNPSKSPMEQDAIHNPSCSLPPSSSPLQIERPSIGYIIRPPPKGVLHKLSYNLNVRATQHNNIVEDFA